MPLVNTKGFGDAHSPDLALLAQPQKDRGEDVISVAVLLQPDTMEEVDIDIVGSETPEAVFQTLLELSNRVGVIRRRGKFLSGDDHLVPRDRLQCFPDNGFRAINLSCIEQ